MDIELARTFLAAVATGNFEDASHRLHIAQSTASTRIQRLEQTFGAELFVRNKSGTRLTTARVRSSRTVNATYQARFS
jgi:DNA-binding transcriptional LysR family regulator